MVVTRKLSSRLNFGHFLAPRYNIMIHSPNERQNRQSAIKKLNAADDDAENQWDENDSIFHFSFREKMCYTTV